MIYFYWKLYKKNVYGIAEVYYITFDCIAIFMC